MGDFEPTAEELQRLGEMLKKEEFRKLLAEYAEEISNPEQRQKNEEEIRQMEAQQGHDVTFINPEPGFVLKTTVAKGDSRKVFVNVCQSKEIEQPKFVRATQNGRSGASWSLPHSTAPHREDLDKEGKRCIVYDVVFHPDALRMAATNAAFKQMLAKTAVDAIGQRFPEHTLNPDVKYPKMTFKGTPLASRTMLRRARDGGPVGPPAVATVQQAFTALQKPAADSAAKASAPAQQDAKAPADGGTITPTYTLVHRHDFDLQDHTLARTAADRRPHALVITVHLPLCASAAPVDVDISDGRMVLTCSDPGPYHLVVPLRYPVNEEAVSAVFDRSTRKLAVTIPLAPVPAAADPNPATALVTQLAPSEAADSNDTDEAASTAAPTEASGPSQAVTGGSEAANARDAAVNSATSAPPTSAPPALSFHQDAATLTAVVHAAGSVEGHTIERTVGPVTVHSYVLTLTPADGPPRKLQLDFDAAVDPARCSCSASPDNTVAVVVKTEAMLWQRVVARWDDGAPQEHRLQTVAQARAAAPPVDAWAAVSSVNAAMKGNTSSAVKDLSVLSISDSDDDNPAVVAPTAAPAPTNGSVPAAADASAASAGGKAGKKKKKKGKGQAGPAGTGPSMSGQPASPGIKSALRSGDRPAMRVRWAAQISDRGLGGAHRSAQQKHEQAQKQQQQQQQQQGPPAAPAKASAAASTVASALSTAAISAALAKAKPPAAVPPPPATQSASAAPSHPPQAPPISYTPSLAFELD